jgi:hypothetical protein
VQILKLSRLSSLSCGILSGTKEYSLFRNESQDGAIYERLCGFQYLSAVRNTTGPSESVAAEGEGERLIRLAPGVRRRTAFRFEFFHQARVGSFPRGAGCASEGECPIRLGTESF